MKMMYHVTYIRGDRHKVVVEMSGNEKKEEEEIHTTKCILSGILVFKVNHRMNAHCGSCSMIFKFVVEENCMFTKKN